MSGKSVRYNGFKDYEFWFRFVKADYSLGQDVFCRAYINFVNQEDIFIFQEKFDGYVFVDTKGNEYIAIVEFAPHQKIGLQKDGKRKDPKINSIEQDPEYMKFLEILEKGNEVRFTKQWFLSYNIVSGDWIYRGNSFRRN